LVNTFYVPFDEDDDQITPVIARAIALLTEARQPMPGSYLDLDAAAPAVDHLTDIRTVLRDEPRVRTQVAWSPAHENGCRHRRGSTVRGGGGWVRSGCCRTAIRRFEPKPCTRAGARG
jgi:hypothetical protein